MYERCDFAVKVLAIRGILRNKVRALVDKMKELPVVRGGVIIAQCAVDDDIFDELVGRTISSVKHDDVRQIRPMIYIDGKSQEVGRYVMGKNPSNDDTTVVDHIDRQPCNNVRSNLRWLSRSDNVRNQRSKTASGYRGVSRTSQGTKWQAHFFSNGHQMYGGVYETAKEAALAHDEMARNTLGIDLDLIVLNFPKESSNKGLAHIKRRMPTGLPRGVSKLPNGKYRLHIHGYPQLQVNTIEEAQSIHALCAKDRNVTKLTKRIVDGKIALLNKSGTVTGYTIVDDDILHDMALKCPCLSPNGYAQIRIGGVTTSLHRYIYGATLEEGTVMPAMIDHIDGNKLNNLRSNLRASNSSSNAHTKRKRSGTSSIYYGVSWCARDRLWHSKIKKDGIITQKYFADELDAARFYNENAIRLYGTHAQLNKLPSGSGLDGPMPVDDRGRTKTTSGA